MGITKKRNKSNEAAAAVVKSPKAKDISSEATGDKKIWKASQIAKMKPWEFEKHEAELDAARSEGRIDFQS
jgi:cell fate regulator YaaT (PSP1 superfamily)